jgi:hypothetical protein
VNNAGDATLRLLGGRTLTVVLSGASTSDPPHI